MTIALIDNGSLDPAAHENLRAAAAAIAGEIEFGVRRLVAAFEDGNPEYAKAATSRRTPKRSRDIHAVSWKHSDRIPGLGARTLATFVRAEHARGERDFIFIPFFISAQGAIGSALRRDLERLQSELGGLDFTFTSSLAERGVLACIVADRIRATIAAQSLRQPAVIVVDHGGPSAASAALRDTVAADVRRELGAAIGPLAAASMEGADYPHHRPLLADQLAAPGFDRGDVVIAPLFLSPGRHAGPEGDLARIAGAAIVRSYERQRVDCVPDHSLALVATSITAAALRCHFTALVGTHPLAAANLATALRETLAARPTEIFA